MKAKIIGIGEGGCKVVEKLYLRDREICPYAVVDSDRYSLEYNKVEQQVLTLKYCTSPGSSPQREYGFVYESKDKIISILDDGTTNVILVAGFGGGSSGSVLAVAEIARGMGICVDVVCSIPFMFEKIRKRDIAFEGIRKQREAGLDVVMVDLKVLWEKYIDSHVSVKEAFTIADGFMIQAVIKTYSRIIKQSMKE